MNSKIIVICGQTATGKSDLAVKIALALRSLGEAGEIISADSRQVYKGLDLGTGKITVEEMQGVPHHLLDIVDPKKNYSVSEYKRRADKKIQEIIQRGNVPIICGGTGFYIDAVIYDQDFPEVKPNISLRKELENKSAEELHAQLKVFDPSRAGTVDAKNKVRLVRAIEIALALGSVPKRVRDKEKYNLLLIGLSLSTEELKLKIENRLHSRLALGMLEEAIRLHEEGLSYNRMKELGLEYKYQSLFLQNKISLEEMKELIISESLKYAKRQMTWFKRNKKINWFEGKETQEILKLVEKFLF